MCSIGGGIRDPYPPFPLRLNTPTSCSLWKFTVCRSDSTVSVRGPSVAESASSVLGSALGSIVGSALGSGLGTDSTSLGSMGRMQSIQRQMSLTLRQVHRLYITYFSKYISSFLGK
jgi:hypothetical protein